MTETIHTTREIEALIQQIAAEGVTTADLKEQFEHNTRMRELAASASQTVARVHAGDPTAQVSTAVIAS